MYIIHYRVRTTNNRWKQKAERLYCDNKKVARARLADRIRESSNRPPEARELTFRGFVEGVWRPHLDLGGVKPSTRKSYDSGLENHILPAFGELLVTQICPLHIEELLRTKLKEEMSPKTLRNIVALLSGIFSLAVDNDLIARSPVRKKHRPNGRYEKNPPGLRNRCNQSWLLWQKNSESFS